jgi:hypothetical protein
VIVTEDWRSLLSEKLPPLLRLLQSPEQEPNSFARQDLSFAERKQAGRCKVSAEPENQVAPGGQ